MSIDALSRSASSAPIAPEPFCLSSEQRASLERFAATCKWAEIPGMENVIDHSPEIALFLKTSRLGYYIAGLSNTLKLDVDQYGRELNQAERNLKKGIFIGVHGEIMILKNGVWALVSEVMEELELHPQKKVLVSKNDPDQEWSYTYPSGLTRVDPREIIASYKLCPSAQSKLKELTEVAEEPGPRGFLQLYSNGKDPYGKLGHIGCRLISPSGDVYSIGLGTPSGQEALDMSRIQQALGTYNTQIFSPDFKEYATFDARKISTVAITEEQFQTLLEEVQTIAQSSLRFHIMHLNCSRFASHLLKKVNIDPGETQYVSEFLRDVFLPEGTESIPYVGIVIVKIQNIVKPIFAFLGSIVPDFISSAFHYGVSVLLFIPNKLGIALRNIIILALGGSQVPFELNGETDDSAQVDPSADLTSDGLCKFGQYMTWKDIFREDHIGIISSPLKISSWQDERTGTFNVEYPDQPQLHIVPYAPPLA